MQTINHVVVHKLVKAQHGKASVVERKSNLPITDAVTTLILAIHDLYAGKASKGYGRFDDDAARYPSSAILRDAFIDGKTDFLDASRSLLTVLADKAAAVPLATGGYVLMAQITGEANVRWFLVAMINNVQGSVINDATLEVIDAMHVDLVNLRVAGRVNLSEWESGDPALRYVGFLKQRGEVADYFKDFLGCRELVSDSVETKKLVGVLKNFAKGQGLDPKAEEDLLQSAYGYCNELSKHDEALSLDALSNTVWPDAPSALLAAFAASESPVSDGFVPDARSIKTLMRLKFKTPYWTIDLDRLALSQGYAYYNQKKGELTLLKLPAGLKTELDREIDDDG